MVYVSFLPQIKAWSYILVSGPDQLAVTLAEMKSYLKITGSEEDALIASLIQAAVLYGEKYTGRDFINKTYKTYRDNFTDYANIYGPQDEIVLKKSRLQSITSVKYLKDTVLTDVDTSVYYATEDSDYSVLVPYNDQVWPSDVDNRLQAVEIIFVAGYGTTSADVPEDIKDAIKAHVANLFENRGDCGIAETLPDISRRVYNQYKILDIVVGC